MHFASLTLHDLQLLPPLQPEGWADIRIMFEYYARHAHCQPIKLTSGEQLIGVGTSITHRNSAWLAQIIVHPEYRNQGLGTLITQELINRIDRAIFPALSLIATPLGEPVYKKLGFVKTAEYLLLKPAHKLPLFSHATLSESTEADHEQILELDRLASGEDRSVYLKEHLSSAKLIKTNGAIQGFYLPTLHTGPVIACDPEAGLELMKYRLNSTDNSAVLPSENKTAMDFLLQHNYKVINRASRMSLGQPINFKPEMLFNRVSGSLG